MDANAASLASLAKTKVDDPLALSSTQRVIEFYEEAGEDYRHWSPGLNMHLGFYRWGTNPFRREQMLEQLNLEVAQRLKIDANKPASLVDLGCGMGAVARSVARYYPKSTIKGVTLSPSQVRIASQESRNAGLLDQIEILEGNFTDLPFADNSVDGAWAIESACYVAGPAKEDLIREVSRILKPGGRFVVADCFVRNADKQINRIVQKCYSAACKNWVVQEMAALEHFIAAAEKYGVRDLIVEDISWRTAPSLAHAPLAVATFLLKKALVGERLGQQSLNNLKASLQALVIGAHRSKFGYYLISGACR